ncbi:hypothetical protein G7Y89_g9801 [Cudoniella acicularis]|uniref:Rhodopsin domain-containing protein n=1 Tax=Cudoniella acicularis TaxID=354080 RepID=A0A8H4W1J2_9HELO|nr:hypothetical protein G7Y89_g9801 [Cudoniella acicularis]
MAQSQQPTIWGLGIAFSIIVIVAVVLRFQARRIKGQKFESDDWTILVALILGIGVTIDILIMTQLGGLGTHAQYDDDGNPLNPEAIVIFGKTTYALELLTWPAVGMTKISVLLMYKRIFVTPRFKTIAWILVGLVIAWTIAFTFALMFSCTPIASQWDFNLQFTCVNQETLFTTALATDVATDFLVLFLPIYKIKQLQMPFSRKIMIPCIFLLGGLVSIVGIIRIHFLTQVYNVLNDSPEADTTWIYAPVFYWTIIETNVGVLSACLPTLHPIQESATRNHFFSKIRSSLTHLLSSSSGKSSDIRLGSIYVILKSWQTSYTLVPACAKSHPNAPPMIITYDESLDEATSKATRHQEETLARLRNDLKNNRLAIIIGTRVTLNVIADISGKPLSRITWIDLIRNGPDYLVHEGYGDTSNRRTRKAYEAFEYPEIDGLLDTANVRGDLNGVFYILGSHHDAHEVVLDTTDYYDVKNSDGHCLLIRDNNTVNYQPLLRVKYGPRYEDLVGYLKRLLDDQTETHSLAVAVGSDSIRTMVDIAARNGRLDGLIAAAAVNHVKSAIDHSPVDIVNVMNINYNGVLTATTAAAKQMLQWKCREMQGIYSLDRKHERADCKQGTGFTNGEGRGGIRVNSLCPGHIITPMVEDIFRESPETKEIWESENMVGRLAKPEEFRGAALFLIRSKLFMPESLTLARHHVSPKGSEAPFPTEALALGAFMQKSIPANTYRAIGPPAIKDPRDIIWRLENIIHDRGTGKTYTNTELIQALRNPQSTLVQSLGTQAQVLGAYLLENLSLEIPCKFKRGLVSEEWNVASGAHPILVWWNSDVYSWSSLAIIDSDRPNITTGLCYDECSITVSVKFTESGDWIGLDSRGKPGMIRLQGALGALQTSRESRRAVLSVYQRLVIGFETVFETLTLNTLRPATITQLLINRCNLEASRFADSSMTVKWSEPILEKFRYIKREHQLSRQTPLNQERKRAKRPIKTRRAPMPAKFRVPPIRLDFDDLRTVAAFFQEGPGQDATLLRRVRFVSIPYLDDWAAQGGWRRTTEYAFKAFELLHTSWHLMQVSWLRLCLPCSGAVSSVDDPGIWSLLKIRGLPHLTISGPHLCVAPKVRVWLKSRTRKRNSSHGGRLAWRIRGHTTGLLSSTTETTGYLGSSNTNGLTLGIDTSKIKRRWLRGE